MVIIPLTLILDPQPNMEIAKLNYHRLEAGGFANFVSYGLKSFAPEQRSRPEQAERSSGKPTDEHTAGTAQACSGLHFN